MTDDGRHFEFVHFRHLTNLLGTARLCTIAYHPQENGLVERFYRQLKASFYAYEASSKCVDLLPVVILVLRSAIKEPLPLAQRLVLLAGLLHLPNRHKNHSGDSYLTRTHDIFYAAHPTPTRAIASKTPFVVRDLCASSHVPLRTNCVRRPLEAPYSGAHPVLA